MKRSIQKMMEGFNKLRFPLHRKIILAVTLLIALSGFQSIAQVLPLVTVRFSNPQYVCETNTYCVDVEFMADVEDEQLFGLNIRFFYDDNVLEYLSMGDFAEGYELLGDPEIITEAPGSGNFFGLGAGSVLEWINGAVQLTDASSVFLIKDQWVKLFNICFRVDDPDALGKENFCPAIIWDMEENPANGGYYDGDDGVVITLVSTDPDLESAPTTVNVVQFNWQYDFIPGLPFGTLDPVVCVSTTCGYIIPVSNWAIFLAIGLMVIASVFVYRRRIS